MGLRSQALPSRTLEPPQTLERLSQPPEGLSETSEAPPRTSEPSQTLQSLERDVGACNLAESVFGNSVIIDINAKNTSNHRQTDFFVHVAYKAQQAALAISKGKKKLEIAAEKRRENSDRVTEKNQLPKFSTDEFAKKTRKPEDVRFDCFHTAEMNLLRFYFPRQTRSAFPNNNHSITNVGG